LCCNSHKRAHRIVHVAEQLVCPVGFGNETARSGISARADLRWPEVITKSKVRPTIVDLSHKIHSIEGAWHLNINEEQPHVVTGFHHFESGIRSVAATTPPRRGRARAEVTW
jgi:hypothetical protein